MPSYIGHIACAKKLVEQMNISEDDKIKFLIGNLVPDIKQVDIDYSLDEFINRARIQKEKRRTHFRRHTNKILEFPNCDIFYNKYKDEIENHIETFAYFFHLCTDYYYFRYFLPKVVSFLDSKYNFVIEKDDFCFVKIKKTDEVISAKSFFSKISKKSLYKEYSRSNWYLINKYRINLDLDYLRNYIENNGYNTYVEELNINKIYDVFNRLKKVYNNEKYEELLIFSNDNLDEFIDNVVEEFVLSYGYLLEKYK